jgi:type I restriction enzyme M protein
MGITPFQSGDTLRQPAFYDAGKLAVFDVVLANPPFSVEKWGEEVWASDPWQRNFAGLPPSSSGDFAWVQHMVTSMAPKTGRMTVVLPLGALFHSGVESAIRRKLLERDLIDTVIALGPNLFYGTGVPAAIVTVHGDVA